MQSDKIYTEYKQTSNYSNDKILVLSQLNNSDICKQLFKFYFDKFRIK